MPVTDRMTRNPTCCRSDTPLQEVARLMVEHDCGEIPIADEYGRPLGVVTYRDMCRTVAHGKNPLDMTAGDIIASLPLEPLYEGMDDA